MTRTTVRILLLCLPAFLFSCSEKDSTPKGPIVKLGKPGEIKYENKLPKAENVIVLEADEKITFNKDSGEATIEHNKTRQFKPGDVIVANEEQKYLLKIKDVQEKKETRTEVVFRQSRMEDLVQKQNGSFSLEATPIYTIKDMEEYVKIAEENENGDAVYEVDKTGKMTLRNVELVNVDINGEGNWTLADPKSSRNLLKLTGQKVNVMDAVGGKYHVRLNEASIEIIPTIRSHADWSWGLISEMETRFDTRIKYRVDVTYNLAGKIKMDSTVDLLPKKVIPIRIPGAVPVYLDIELAIPAGLEISATGKAKSRVIYEAEYEFQSTTRYDEKTGVKTTRDQQVKIGDKIITVDSKGVAVDAMLYLKPTITTRLYRVLGPYAYLQPYVRGELEVPSRFKKDDLFVGVRGGVGFEVSEPIFTTTVLSYDSGALFDFYKSWDLDSFSGPKSASVGADRPKAVDVTTLGGEGFVVLNAKPLGDPTNAHYELVSQTENGILVPSENFFVDGQLYYYPTVAKSTDKFKLRLVHAGGQKQELTISLNLSPEVQKEITSERFSLTSNSYKVIEDGSAAHADKVPHHAIGGVGLYIAAEPIRTEKVAWLRHCSSSARLIGPMWSGRLSEDEFFAFLLQDCGPRMMPEIEKLRQEYRQSLNRETSPFQTVNPTTLSFNIFDFIVTPDSYTMAKRFAGCETMNAELSVTPQSEVVMTLPLCTDASSMSMNRSLWMSHVYPLMPILDSHYEGGGIEPVFPRDFEIPEGWDSALAITSEAPFEYGYYMETSGPLAAFHMKYDVSSNRLLLKYPLRSRNHQFALVFRHFWVHFKKDYINDQAIWKPVKVNLIGGGFDKSVKPTYIHPPMKDI